MNFDYMMFKSICGEKEKEGMSKEQVIKALKDILLSNDFEGKKEQENALIIVIAELLKQY